MLPQRALGVIVIAALVGCSGSADVAATPTLPRPTLPQQTLPQQAVHRPALATISSTTTASGSFSS